MSSNSEQEDWDVVITARHPWWRLDLKELWRYRDLLRLMVKRDLLAVHKQTVLGPLWHFVQPLFTTLMFAFMFGRVAKLPTDGVPPMVFYMSGIVPWGFFSASLTKSSKSFIAQANLLTKVYFPRLVVPLSTVLANLVGFAVQLMLLAGFIVYFTLVDGGLEWHLTPQLLLLPVVIALMALLGLGLGIMIAAATIRYRDLNFLVSFGVQLLMYASPVIFPASMLTSGTKLGFIVGLNPMTPLINAFRALVFGTPFELGSLTYALVFILITLLLGLAFFRRAERSFADVV
jgi:lipopolysaccharide transport system permease protein